MSNKAKIREDAMRLNPMDDALFMKMAEDRPFCAELLQTILGDKNLTVIENIPQYIAKNLQGRSCTLDLKCSLRDGRVVDVEVQKANDDDHQRRMRYNSALLTTNITDPGEKFKAVPDVIVVFISRFDVFKSGKTIYHMDRVIRETGEVKYNGFAEVYVNAEVDDKSDIAELMEIFTKDEAYDDRKFPATSKRKRRFKTTEEGVLEMCEVIERYRAEGKAEGILKTLSSLVTDGILTTAEAAKRANLSIEEYSKAVAAL